MRIILGSLFLLLVSAGMAFVGMGLIYLLSLSDTVPQQSSAALVAIAYFFLTFLCWRLAETCLKGFSSTT